MAASYETSTTKTPKKQKIRTVIRNAKEQEWTNVSVIPDKGELVYASDVNTLKIGDGTTTYDNLPAISGGSGGTTDYTDLTNKPQIDGVTLVGNVSTADLGFANVATTGNYNDLSNLPTLGTMAAENASDYTKTSSLSNVALSGSYDDLVNKPAFGTAAFANTTDFATAAQGDLANTAVQPTDLANVATTGNYNDLSNKPTIPAAQVNSDWNAFSGVAEILNKPNLANVATSGDYNDLTNKPTVTTYIAGTGIDINTSTNTISTTDPVILNEGTGPSAIGIKGTATGASAIGIGGTSSGSRSIGIGGNAAGNGAIAMGGASSATNSGAIAIGRRANATADHAIQISSAESPSYSNNDANTVKIATGTGNYEVLSADGTIPEARLADVTNATQNQVLTLDSNLNATWANVDSLPSQTSHSGDFLTTNGTAASWTSLANVAVSGNYDDLTNKPYIPEGVVVDQSYNAISTNAQSGTAVAEAIANKVDNSSLANVAFTGSYDDLINQPNIPTTVAELSDASNYALVSSLANVATTGEYDDLLNKPTIPAAQVQTDWNATTGMGVLLNKPTLANVATTGSYDDLINKPYIPEGVVVDQTYNPVSTNAQAGIAVAEAIANKVDNTALANVAFTGEYSDLVNTPVLGDMAYANTSDYTTTSNLANVALSGEYSDLLNTPSIPAAQVQTDWNATTGMGVLLNKPSLANIATSGEYSDLINAPILANVATSGDYNDLINKPTIPSNLANVAFSGDYNDLSNTPVLGTAAYANTSDFATAAEGNLATTAVQPGDLANVATTGEYSDLLNTPSIPSPQVNSDWNSTSGVSEILNKPTLSTVATTGEYSDLLNTPALGSMAYENTTDYTPTSNLANVALTGDYNNLLNTPTLGTAAAANTTDFATAAEGNLATTAVQPGDLANIATTGEYSDLINAPILANVATSGEYSDLINTPTIPTVNNAIITITQGGVTKGSFTLNQSLDDTIALDAGSGGGATITLRDWSL